MGTGTGEDAEPSPTTVTPAVPAPAATLSAAQQAFVDAVSALDKDSLVHLAESYAANPTDTTETDFYAVYDTVEGFDGTSAAELYEALTAEEQTNETVAASYAALQDIITTVNTTLGMAQAGADFTEEELALLTAEPETLSLADQLRQRELAAAYQASTGIATLALGEASDPFYISNVDQMAELAELVNAGNTAFVSANYKLLYDIDLSSVCGVDVGSWTPIGNAGNPFSGTFDGQGHTISNLYIDNSSANGQGLFGYVEGGTLQSFTINGGSVKGHYYVGATVGNLCSNAEVSNVGVQDVIVEGVDCVGGVAGYVFNSSTITNSYATSAVTCGNSASVGGVAGYVESSTITNSYATGAVTGGDNANVGGVVGSAVVNSNITNSYATGAVTSGDSAHVGGVVGLTLFFTQITNSYTTGAVTGGNSALVGGMTGHLSQSSTIANSYATGAVTGGNSARIGGVAGYVFDNSTITNCVALNQSVTCTGTPSNIGAVVGLNEGTVSDSYYWSGIGVSGGTGSQELSYTNNALSPQLSAIFKNVIINGQTVTPDSVWTFADNTLPTLKDVGGTQNSILPTWITGATDSYYINTPKQLADFAASVNGTATGADANGKSFVTGNYSGKTIYLTADIDLSNVCGATLNNGSGVSWTPIGTYGNSFSGAFDGRGHTISNLYISSGGGYQGLFGYVEGGKLQNFTINGGSVKHDYIAGAAVGYLGSNAKVSNVGVQDVTVEGIDYAGGVAGEVYGNSTIINSYATGSVTGAGNHSSVGGVAGSVYNSTITNSYSTSVVTGGNEASVGGVAGEVFSSSITNNYATGLVTAGNDALVGGVAGYMFGSSSITNSYATGAVMGGDKAYVGGVAGGNDISCIVTNCAALNQSVTCTGTLKLIGAVVGYNSGTVANTYYWSGMLVQSDTADTATDVTPKDAFGSQELNYTNDALSTQLSAIFKNVTINGQTVTPDSVWTFADNALPILKNVGGTQNSTLPTWITADANSYCINTAGQLADFAASVNGTIMSNGGKDANGKPFLTGDDSNTYENVTIYLTADIDLSTVCGEDSTSWTPIGNESNPFSGIFEGQGYTISNLYINSSGADLQGLFGYVEGGTLQNFTIHGGSVKGNYRVGAAVGGLVGNDKVSNVGVEAVVVEGTDWVGGVAGYVFNSSTITNSYSTGAVTGGHNAYIGGVAGDVNSSTITNSYSTGSVTGGNDACIGGVAGCALWGSAITNSYSTGSVTGGNDADVGGVAGFVAGGAITNSYFTGAVTGDNYANVGGVAGAVVNGSAITNSYTTGTVTGDNSAYVGGVAGEVESSNITNSYATGAVTGGDDAQVGGVAGEVSNSTITNSYATGAVTGGDSAQVGGVVGAVFGSNTITNSYASTIANCVALNQSVACTGSTSAIGAVVGHSDGTFSGNYYWNGMSVQTNTGTTATDVTPKDNFGSTALHLEDGILHNGDNVFGWTDFDTNTVWTIPAKSDNTPYALALPYLTGTSGRPALALSTVLAPNFRIDYTAETLTGGVSKATYTLSVAGGTSEDVQAATDGTIAIGSEWFGKEITITGGNNSQQITIPVRPAAPSNMGTVSASADGALDGKITGLAANTAYQLSTDGGTTWNTAQTTDAEGNLTGLAAGTYRVRLAATDSSFVGALSTAVTILTKMPVSANDYNGTYDGDAHGITVNAPDGATVAYGTAEGTYDLDESPIYKDVTTGTTVYYQVTKAGYEPVTGKATVTIAPATPTVILKDKTATYTGSSIAAAEASITLVNNETYSGAVTYTYYTNATCTEGKTTTAPTNAGAYYVKASIAASGNYKAAESSAVKLTINNAELTDVDVTQGGTLTYNGHEQTASVNAQATSVNSQEVTFTYSAIEGGTYTNSVPGFTDAGSHTVYYQASAPNHNTATGTFDVTIGKATASVTPPTAITNLVYTGGAQTLIAAGSTTGGTMEYSTDGVNYDTELPTGTNAGTYTVYYRVTGGNNYNDAPGGSFTVNIGNATLTGVSVAQSGALTYNGREQAASVNAKATSVNNQEVTFTYSTTEGGTYSTSVPTFTNAGSHMVYYQASAPNHNTATGTFTVTIAPLDITGATVDAFEAMTYTGSAQTPNATVTINGLPVTGSWSPVTNVSDTTTFIASGNFTGRIENVVTGMAAKTVDALDLTAVLTAPVKGATPETSLNSTATQYTGSVSWSDNPSKFLGGTAYTATVVLSPTANYTLSGLAVDAFSYAGATVTSTAADADGKITVTIAFPATEDRVATSMQTTGTPTKTTYNLGEAFDPTGLTITVIFDDGTTLNLTGDTPGYSVTPATMEADTSSVVIRYGGQSTEAITGITVRENLTSVTAPLAITNVAHGAAKTAAALGLPETVSIVTSSGATTTAKVIWDVEAAAYDPAVQTQQSFTVQGTVVLPDGMTNVGNVSLTASVSVTVQAAQPADDDDGDNDNDGDDSNNNNNNSDNNNNNNGSNNGSDNTDASATTTSVKALPLATTGDNTALPLVLALLALSSAGLVVASRKRAK